MSMMEEFLQLQEKLAKMEKVLNKKEEEINKKDEKILNLSEKVNDLTNKAAKSISDTRHFRGMVSNLESDKKTLEKEKNRLMSETDALKLQLKQFALIVETTNQTLQAKEESLLSKEKQLQQKDVVLVEKDKKLEDFSKKFEGLQEEKENYQREKFEFMEQLSNEKLKLVEKIGELEKNIQANDEKYKKMKKKSRDAQDGLLGASMEMEKIREEKQRLSLKLQEMQVEIEKLQNAKILLEEKITPKSKSGKKGKKGGHPQVSTVDSKKLQGYQELIAKLEMKIEQFEKGEISEITVEDVAKELISKKTGTFNNIAAFMLFLKTKLEDVKRTIRIILPDLKDIEKYEIKNKFLGLPKNILKNLACTVDTDKDEELLGLLKERNFRITDYRGVKLFALTVDNLTAALAVYDKKNESLTGVFSNDQELVRLLSQSIISPFIKGIKLN